MTVAPGRKNKTEKISENFQVILSPDRRMIKVLQHCLEIVIYKKLQ